MNTFKNLQAENNALGYMGYTLMDSYDVLGCSQKCDAINGCSAFNVGELIWPVFVFPFLLTISSI